jgi:hypothetical protein
MPINYNDYHPKWRLISKLIRYVRAKNKCEDCGLENEMVIKRLQGNMYRKPCSEEWDMIYAKVRSGGYNMSGALKRLGFTRIVLTVAHLDHDKTNNRFWNLRALCQRCHLYHDRKQHAENRKYGRNHKKQQYKLL